ncbi:McbB family protein [Virgibacillus sp. AGTR]|uniref:McbB family protein n=1 Tax=Virgibacillus sp. AGTR TaxID=2812055 RepID=UPI001D15ED0C|nr:McbB family protein [Virgibacillus sp. AGTR]MCC2251897.1 McbB family protein [Virgibacillus sp. AGTR]
MVNNDVCYVINPFILHSLSDKNLVVQHRYGVVVITDDEMKKVILNFEQKSGEKISVVEMKKLFNSNSKKAISFLFENRIINKVTLPNFNIEGIHYFSNSRTVEELISRSFKHNNNFSSYFNDINSYYEVIEKNKNELFAVFLNPYDKQLAYKFRNYFSENENTLSIMSYIYHGRLYIESIYSHKWKTPCHICQINHIESELRLGAAQGVTYQQIIDHLYTKDSSFRAETPLEFGDEINVAAQITNRLNLLAALDNGGYIEIEEFTKGLVMDIKTKKVQLGTTHHWELCDCYE